MADGELKIEHGAEAAPKPQPGQVIAPGAGGASARPPAEPASQSSTEQSPPSAPPQIPEPSKAPEQSAPQPAAPRAAEAGYSTPAASTENTQPQEDGAVSWTASEFIAHEKSGGWYIGVAIAGVLVAGLVFLITRDYISAVVVLVGTFSLAVLGSKKPKQQGYRVDRSGLSIGPKHYEFAAFKSFAIVQEGAFASIVFMPLKRFAPLTTIYYPPEDEKNIVDIIAQHLPLEEHRLDAVDHLMQRIRF